MIVYVVSSLLTAKLVLGAFSTENAARQYIADEHSEYTEHTILPGVFESPYGEDSIHIVECELNQKSI